MHRTERNQPHYPDKLTSSMMTKTPGDMHPTEYYYLQKKVYGVFAVDGTVWLFSNGTSRLDFESREY